MVTDDGQPLDEYILQIFEEQEELFYFPVTSQNTARNFVKALHNKGVPYERVCKEIGEFEHNFTAWRKGLGRIGIGNRIIQRINKPLEDVLMSDDEDDIQDILARLKEKKRESGGGGENDRVPPITRPHDDSPSQWIKDSIQRHDEQVLTSGASKTKQQQQQDITDSWRQCIDTKMKALEDDNTNEKSSAPNSPQLSRASSGQLPHASPGQLSRTSSGQLSRTSSGQLSRTSSGQLSRTSSGQLSGAELEQKEPGVVDFRSVLKRHVDSDKVKGHHVADRRSMPPSSYTLEENGDSQSRLCVSMDRIHRLDVTERHSLRARSEPRDTQYQQQAEHGHDPSKTHQQLNKHAAEQRMEEKTQTEQQNSPREEVNEVIKTTVTNASSRTSERSRARDSRDSVDNRREPLPLRNDKKDEQKNKAPLATEETDTSSSESERTSESEESSESQSSSDEEEEDENNGNANESKSTNEANDVSDEMNETDDMEDVGEDYDSELDQDNPELTTETRKLANQIAELKARMATVDGWGYIYVFSDSTAQTAMPRVKIAVSRFPNKRLEQALCFNINMMMMATEAVGLRRKALAEARKRLEMYEIQGQDGWYQGPLGDILAVVKSVAKVHPPTSSEC